MEKVNIFRMAFTAIVQMVRFLWIALTIRAFIGTGRAIVERRMEIADFFEIMDFFFGQKHSDCNRMHRSISQTFIKEATSLIKMLEVFSIGFRSQEF